MMWRPTTCWTPRNRDRLRFCATPAAIFRWHRRYAHDADFLSETALVTLRHIAKRANERLHKQALKTLSDRGFIKPFRNKWRIATPKSEIDLIEKRLKDLIKEKEGRQ
jgi:hypothetical protein